MADDPLASPLIPAALRDALRFSPDNAPLLLHAADTVLGTAGYPEAEALYTRVLALQPGSAAARFGLATAFFQQGKNSAALVIVEDLLKQNAPDARTLLLHARLASQADELQLAARQYERARTADPALTDSDLEQRLGQHLKPRPQPVLPKKPPARPPADEENSDARDTPDFLRPLDEGGADTRERLPAGDLPTDSATGELERPALRFADVGGMDSVKDEIRMKIILPLRQPELFQAYGKKAGGGILLYGPPGCGKTFLARATAGEVSASFLAIGISDVLDMWIGQSEKNLHAIFEQARAHRPCVLFFDEVDALGANRTDMLRSGGRQIINQFLAELDGVQSDNEGVLILAATNAPWHLDPAFRRPGRFDRILFVPPPDAPARAAILRLQLKGRPVEAIDFEGLAAKTEGFSGADLKAIIDSAVEEKLRAAMQAGALQPIKTSDLATAIKRHRPTARDWFETARNYALYANQSGLYDDILAFLKIKK
jgi:AAA+ superfamily predicted ATPase